MSGDERERRSTRERRAARAADAVSRRAYALVPARPLAVRVARWSLVCALSAAVGAALGAAAFAVWKTRPSQQAREAPHAGAAAPDCPTEPADAARLATELTRARLALAEESAARAAVQKTADDAAAEVARLSADLQFLRARGAGR